MQTLCAQNNINIIKSKDLVDGVAIHPMTEDDYRKTAKLSQNKEYPYHIYQLQSEKPLHIVLKGIPKPIAEEEIEELQQSGFHPESINRMRSRKDKRPLHMVRTTS